MTSPKFSVLIPTRDRPATLRHTLATVLSQPGEDYEVVVADNCGTPETRRLVEEQARPSLRYTRSDEILPMAQNWERGLDLCEGEYVTVLGDDDAFVPSTLGLARKLIEATQPELLFWAPHTYGWPDTIVYWFRNQLIVNLAEGAREQDSRETLRGFYGGEVTLEWLPMIYSAFFHRGIIDEARRRYDGFFVPKEAAPDIASGILGLHLTKYHICSDRPLSIRGNSGKSNGTAQWARSLGQKQREIYFREERIGLEGMIHKSLVPSPNLNVIVASAKLRCREKYFPHDAALSVDLQGVLSDIVNGLNLEPEAYEENLSDARALAAKLGVSLDPSLTPARVPRERKPSWGPGPGPDNRGVRLTVNGDLAGLRNIEDAARFIESLQRPLDDYVLA